VGTSRGSSALSLVTRCPACGTAFRVQPAQLAAQSGTVRCGKCGELFNGVAALVAPGEVVGVVGRNGQVDIARRRAGERGLANVRFEVGSIYALPFPDGSFDVAYAHTVLQHVREPLRALREMRRVLKPGGLVAAVLQPVWAKSDDQVRAIGADLLSLLARAGFQSTRLEFKTMKPIASVCAFGAR